MYFCWKSLYALALETATSCGNIMSSLLLFFFLNSCGGAMSLKFPLSFLQILCYVSKENKFTSVSLWENTILKLLLMQHACIVVGGQAKLLLACILHCSMVLMLCLMTSSCTHWQWLLFINGSWEQFGHTICFVPNIYIGAHQSYMSFSGGSLIDNV